MSGSFSADDPPASHVDFRMSKYCGSAKTTPVLSVNFLSPAGLPVLLGTVT